MARVGTQASILRYVSTPDGNHHLICQGQERFRVVDLADGYPFMVARVERIDTVVPAGDTQSEALFLRLKERAIEVLGLLPQTPPEIVRAVQAIESAQNLTDLVAGYLDIKPAEKQELLEQVDLRPRMERLLALLAHRIEVMQLSREIDQRTKSSMGQREREFLLREQMKAIQKELGEDGVGNAAEIADLRKAVDAAGMPQEALKQVDTELKRLERILEFLAVRKLKPDGHSPILCLVGPPGVGKTSLGQSIARALGRPFVLVSLGGVHGKADVHVHVPDGAIPKDGPSAGVAMYVAMAWLFSDRPVHSDIAMTGEISLRGLVLPVGGIKEKVLAALAAGIRRVMLPARNRKDLDDLPKQARDNLDFVFLDDVAQAMEVAVGAPPLVAQHP